jgi:hypothetical protein
MNTLEWVFSGIGAVVVSIILDRFVFRKSKTLTTKNETRKDTSIKDINMIDSNSNSFQIIEHQVQHLYQTKQEISETISITNILPSEIKDSIGDNPLFQQDNIAKNYIGLNVVWKLNLLSISESNNSIRVSFIYEKNIFPDISIETTIEAHPFFKIAKQDTPFEVSGKIAKCDKYHIHLELRSLKELT